MDEISGEIIALSLGKKRVPLGDNVDLSHTLLGRCAERHGIVLKAPNFLRSEITVVADDRGNYDMNSMVITGRSAHSVDLLFDLDSGRITRNEFFHKLEKNK